MFDVIGMRFFIYILLTLVGIYALFLSLSINNILLFLITVFFAFVSATSIGSNYLHYKKKRKKR